MFGCDGKFIFFIVGMASHICTYVKLIKLYAFKIDSLLYVNFVSIKILKSQVEIKNLKWKERLI